MSAHCQPICSAIVAFLSGRICLMSCRTPPGTALNRLCRNQPAVRPDTERISVPVCNDLPFQIADRHYRQPVAPLHEPEIFKTGHALDFIE